VRALENHNKEVPLSLAVENVAAKYEFNQDLHHLVDAVEGFPYVGWCLDLAHTHAAGVSDSNLQEVMVRCKPLVCHSNFPGSLLGSGRDVHGWRYQWSSHDVKVSESHCLFWDALVRLLFQSKVPLIMEGGSFDGEMEKELSFMRQHLSS
jgi:sugar phosphate isomerase/epimerase